MQTYVASADNAPVLEAVKGLETAEKPLHLFIHGPKGSGKSTYVKQISQDLHLRMGDTIFACSGADIAIALQLETDERSDVLFEKLGARSALIIDDIAILTQDERGDFLLSLLLAERDRQNFSTIIFADTPIAATPGLNKSIEGLSQFEEMKFAPLQDSERANFVRAAEKEYRTANSPAVEDDVVVLIVKHMGDDFHNMENAIHFLMVQDSYGADDTITETIAKELFEVE